MLVDKTFGIRRYAEVKKLKRQEEVLVAIDKMKMMGETINFYTVSRKTGASKSYLYDNKVLSERIKLERLSGNTSGETEKSREVKMKALMLENKRLKSINKQLEGYREKYEKKREEIEQLKEQLSKSYTIW